MARFSGALAACACAALISGCRSSKISAKIYTTLTQNGVSRLLHKDGTIGATTDQTGDVGTLYRISSLSELQDFKKAPNDDYVALISDGILYRKENEVPVFKVMQDTGKLKGILVYKNASISVSDREAFSAGATSPNAAYGAAANKYTAWNPSGGGFGDDGHEGMHWIDLKVPMFELTAEDQAVVLQKFEEHNQPGNQNGADYPLYGARLTFWMWGAPDTETCMRRRYCDAIGGQNILGFATPYDKANQPVIMIAAASDAVSMMHSNAWGANADAAAVAATLGAAKMVGTLTKAQREAFDTNIMFTLFAGEHFGYIGSTAMGHKLDENNLVEKDGTETVSGTIPAKQAAMLPGNIKYYLETSQLATQNSALYYHTDNGTTNTATDNLVKAFGTWATNGVSLNAAGSTEMPPSSFRGLFGEFSDFTVRGNVGAAVVTAFDKTGYSDTPFETIHDDGESIQVTNTSTTADITSVCEAARIIALTAVDLAVKYTESGKANAMPDPPMGDVDCDYILELLQMMLFRAARPAGEVGNIYVDDGTGEKKPLSRYVDVYHTGLASNHHRVFFYHMLAALSDPDVTTTTPAEANDGKPFEKGPCKGWTHYGDGRTGTYSYSSQDYNASASWNKISAPSKNASLLNCYSAPVAWMSAVSPAFSDSGLTYTAPGSKNWSTYTESTWTTGALDIFLRADPAKDNAAVGCGVAYFLLCFVGVFFFNRKFDFTEETAPLSISAEADNDAL